MTHLGSSIVPVELPHVAPRFSRFAVCSTTNSSSFPYGGVRQRLGETVAGIVFDRGVICFPALSPQHYRSGAEETFVPVVKLVQTLQSDATRLATFRAELDSCVGRHLENNLVRQHYLMTRAIKR
ncbi:hypothetical protein [Paraburkholderia guartelaensis]|uniref:hypothetical protein n=1 Tax=Paraburkholderia guartelaensis TaxID=2546446 RepID=UPI002AB5EEA7|nr:hypothetical protein [Paraburkholderia guartelaensis]